MAQLLSSISLLLAHILAFLLLQRQMFMVGFAAQAQAQAQTNQLNAGSTMTPTRSNLIQSSSGLFAFGFCSLDPSLQPNQFILAIWFDFNARDCTHKSVVWFARNGDDAVIATEQYALNLNGGSPLSLINDQQKEVWTPSKKYASTLVLQESGNLQLFGQPDGVGGVADVLLWESFVDPTDVLLPGNNITVGPADTKSRQLSSKKTYTDFSSGRFVLAVQNDSNVVLYMRDQESGTDYPYWSAKTDYQHGCNATLFFNDSGIYNNITNCAYGNTNTVVQLEKIYTEGYYKYMSLDPDGTVRVYVHPKNNTDGNSGSWDMIRLFPEDGRCGRASICGPNSYCTISPDKYQHVNCSCPVDYKFWDPQHSYKGCTPNFIPHICDGKDHSGEFRTEEMQTTSWSTEFTYKKRALSSHQEQECITNCLNSCFCAAVLIDDNSCMEVWTLTSGRQASGITMKSLIKVRQSMPAISHVSLKTKLLYITISVLAIVSGVSMYNLWKSYMTEKKAKMSMLGLRSFTYKEIKQATGGFKELLGRGGFGHVFKGELSYLEPPYVAVKKLIRPDEFGERDFDNEVQSIGQIHHKNLARLIGYCKQGMHRMLVFQYMQGGTLAEFIFQPERPCWSCIAEAAIGIARGLEYLHEGCKSEIIHCDIKPENILFDDIHTPKITDFGIARLLGDQKTQHTITSRGIAGTIPYAAPEWFDGGGKVNSKVDVYSFGVVLLEMICCRRAAAGGQPNNQGESTTMRLSWVESLVRSGKAELLVGGESEALADMESVERFARVAIWCLQEEPSARPRMHKVVQMLEGTVDVDTLPDPPRPPPFSAILPADGNRSLPHSAVALEID